MMHNMRRRKETSRIRMNRVINGYVEIKHPDIFAKAKTFYTRLDQLYPNKKDLRKTYEYCVFETGSKENKYKYQRNLQGISDNMVLEIELMDTSATPTVAADSPPAVIPPTVIPPAAIPPAVIPPAIAPTVIPDVGAEVTLPFVSNEIIDEIIEDLRKDPEINTFFDEILTTGETPLEEELATLGFLE